jgi:uncharacterized protein
MSWRKSRYNLFFEADGLEVAYNSRTGEYLELDAEGRAAAQHILDAPDEPPADARSRHVRDSLIELGFLTPSDLDEVASLVDRHRAWSTGDQMILSVALTQDCNFDCTYCFEDHLAGSAIAPVVQDRVIDYVRRHAPRMKTLAIDWYGGEPLLELDTLVRMDGAVGAICAGSGCAYESSISTNGLLLTAAVVDRLRAETSVGSLRICIDGPRDLHDRYRPRAGGGGTFDEIWANLEYAAGHFRIKLRINVDKANWERTDELLDLVEQSSLGARVQIAIKPIVSARIRPDEEAFTPREFAQTEPELKRRVLARGLQLDGKPERSCGHCAVYSANQFMIDWRGNLYKCSDTFQPDEAVGRLTDGGVAEVDEARLRPWLEFPTEWDEQCRRCLALPLCMGGCTFKRFAVGADWCGAERYNLREYARLRYESRRARAAAPPAAAESLVQLRARAPRAP